MWLLQRKRHGHCRLIATYGLRFKGVTFNEIEHSWLGVGSQLESLST